MAENESKLKDLESLATTQLDDLDSAQSVVADLNTSVATTRNEMEAASPEHLKDRLHAAQIKRVDAEGVMAQALAALEWKRS